MKFLAILLATFIGCTIASPVLPDPHVTMNGVLKAAKDLSGPEVAGDLAEATNFLDVGHGH